MRAMWPDYYPPECPPPDARRDTIDVYRLVSADPPVPSDFVPVVLEMPHRTFAPEKFCIACGLSVFQSLEGALRVRARYKPLRNKRLARGTIQPQDGLVLETGESSHTTWWCQSKAPHANFTKVLNDDWA
mgnify:FL=1